MDFPVVPTSIVAVSLLLLSACTGSSIVVHDIPVAVNARHEGSTLSAQNLRGLFARATQLVETTSNTSLAGLTLHIVEDDDIDGEVHLETQRLVNAQFDHSEYAAHFVSRIMGAQSGTYLALYSARQDAVLVSKQMLQRFLGGIQDDRLARRAVLALLIHEAVHAADDRRHDINGVRTLDFRAAFAQSAVFEGHAQWQTRQLCSEANCLDGLQFLDRFMFGEIAPNKQTQSSSTLSRNVIEYSYVEGERFIQALASRHDGDKALERLLSHPPVDPIQILSPNSWPDTDREQRNRRLFKSIEAIDHPWNSERYELIHTSPLKGINLRSNPERRAAAVDGFTRLLTAMAAAEIHSVNTNGSRPVDITILQGQSRSTALLFAKTLHANNVAQDKARNLGMRQFGDTTLWHTSRTYPATTSFSRADMIVGVHGHHIIQLAATDTNVQLLEDYARSALTDLSEATSAETLSRATATVLH